MIAGRQSQYGRGRGSYRESADKARTPDKNAQKSSFRTKKNVNFDPKEYMVAECSVRDIEIFKQVFDFLDDDYDGMLTPMDLRKAIREYGGYKPGRPFVYVAMSVFDTDDGGEITFKEFVKLMVQRPCESDTEEDIKRIFENFDEDNKGFISEEDLLAAAEELNEEVTPSEIKEMIAQCDPDGEGVIKLENFILFNKKKNFD
jgi:Ca2+-binding EF-hand superfamily protein